MDVFGSMSCEEAEFSKVFSPDAADGVEDELLIVLTIRERGGIDGIWEEVAS